MVDKKAQANDFLNFFGNNSKSDNKVKKPEESSNKVAGKNNESVKPKPKKQRTQSSSNSKKLMGKADLNLDVSKKDNNLKKKLYSFTLQPSSREHLRELTKTLSRKSDSALLEEMIEQLWQQYGEED